MASLEAELAAERSKIGHLNVDLIFRDTRASELVAELAEKDAIISEQGDVIQKHLEDLTLVSELQSQNDGLSAAMASLEEAYDLQSSNMKHLAEELGSNNVKVSDMILELSAKEAVISEQGESIQVKEEVIAAQVSVAH
jgi:hypothetical protein